MDERPEQPPEGKLIAEALDNLGISIRQAAKRAKISYGRWRQITSGYQNVSPGSWAAVRGPAATVARMARAAGVSPEQLEEAGRPDAAGKLREIIAAEQRPALMLVPGDSRSGSADGPIGRILNDPDLSEEEKRGATALIRGMRGIGSGSGG
jgi:transcriptional regulator with XRE-family HTH domain